MKFVVVSALIVIGSIFWFASNYAVPQSADQEFQTTKEFARYLQNKKLPENFEANEEGFRAIAAINAGDEAVYEDEGVDQALVPDEEKASPEVKAFLEKLEASGEGISEYISQTLDGCRTQENNCERALLDAVIIHSTQTPSAEVCEFIKSHLEDQISAYSQAPRHLKVQHNEHILKSFLILAINMKGQDRELAEAYLTKLSADPGLAEQVRTQLETYRAQLVQ